MKKLRLVLSVLFILAAANSAAQASNIGYADFDKVLKEYNFAKNAYKEIDAKNAELRQYVLDKEKQFKNIDSPVKKKSFEEKTQKEFNAKTEKINELTAQKEKAVRDNILSACKSVAASKQLDAVVDGSVIYAGGVDVTNDILEILNASKK